MYNFNDDPGLTLTYFTTGSNLVTSDNVFSSIFSETAWQLYAEPRLNWTQVY